MTKLTRNEQSATTPCHAKTPMMSVSIRTPKMLEVSLRSTIVKPQKKTMRHCTIARGTSQKKTARKYAVML